MKYYQILQKGKGLQKAILLIKLKPCICCSAVGTQCQSTSQDGACHNTQGLQMDVVMEQLDISRL